MKNISVLDFSQDLQGGGSGKKKKVRITVWKKGYKREEGYNFSFALTGSVGTW